MVIRDDIRKTLHPLVELRAGWRLSKRSGFRHGLPDGATPAKEVAATLGK